MTQADARERAAEYIREGVPSPWGITPVIIDEQTCEIDIGWVFFYESKEYLETGDFSHRLAGNAPLVVSKRDGHVYVTWTASPVEEYLAEIRDQEARRTS